MSVTYTQGQRIIALRNRNVGYRAIAAELGISRDAVRNYCKTRGLAGFRSVPAYSKACLYCGSEIHQPARGRKRKFCCDVCCRKWWKEHPQSNRQSKAAQYETVCQQCGQTFLSYGNDHRRYCSRACYFAHRFGPPGTCVSGSRNI